MGSVGDWRNEESGRVNDGNHYTDSDNNVRTSPYTQRKREREREREREKEREMRKRKISFFTLF